MKIKESAEDYLEAILILEKKNGAVQSVDIANYLGFSKPSVSIAMKKFRENNLVSMDHNNLIELLPEGRKIAERTYERHTTLSRCFRMLGVAEPNATEDACRVEHVISQETFSRIKDFVRKFEESEEKNESQPGPGVAS